MEQSRTRIAKRAVAVAFAAICLTATAAAPAAAAPSLDVAKVAAAPGKCSVLAARQARAAAARAGAGGARRAAQLARRATKQRCLARQKRAKRQQDPKAVPPTQVPGELVVGIDGGWGGWSQGEIEQREQLGASVTRHEWDPAEPVDAQDELMEVTSGEIHTRVHALLGGNQLGDPNHYREWVVAFVRRYGVGGSFWKQHPEYDEGRYAVTTIELGNEPYFGEMSASLYADTVRPTLEELHRLGLPVEVALASRVYGSDTSWIDTLYARIPNLNSLFTAFADHPYWYGHDPATVSPAGPFGRIETLRRRMNEKGASTKPIYITEYGESTAGCGGECVDEATQAAHLQAMINAVASRPDWGVKMLSLFQLRDRGSSSGDRELQFGLLRQDGSAKPAYTVAESAVQRFAD